MCVTLINHAWYLHTVKYSGKDKTREILLRPVVARGWSKGVGDEEEEHRTFWGSETVLHLPVTVDIRDYTFVEAPGMYNTDGDVNYGLELIILYQYRLIDFNKWANTRH